MTTVEGRGRLHRQLEDSDVSDWSKMVVHALIEAGLVRRLECAYPECRFPSRAFPRWVRGRRQLRGMRMVIDHVVPRAAGGTNRADNLQLLHETCNGHKGNHGDKTLIASYRAGKREEVRR